LYAALKLRATVVFVAPAVPAEAPSVPALISLVRAIVPVVAGMVTVVVPAAADALSTVVPEVEPLNVAPVPPIVGRVNVLFVRVWVPVRVATVESIAIVTAAEPL